MPSAGSVAQPPPAGRRAWVVLLGGLAFVAAFVASFGLRYHVRQNDETGAIWAGRLWSRHFPHGLASAPPYDARGPERLMGLLWTFVDKLVLATSNQFAIAHVLVAILWASAGIPVYLLARGIDIPEPYAVAAGLLAVSGPFAIFGITFLNTTPGFVTLTWATYLAWRTTLRPSVGADLWFLLAAALALLARVGHAPFLLMLIPAVASQTWRDLGPATAQARLKAFPRRLWRDHPVLVAIGLIAILLLLVKGQAGVLGAYGDGIAQQHITLHGLYEEAQHVFSRVATGTGFLPVLIGLPWLLREAIWPSRRESGPLAVLGLSLCAAYLYVFFTAAVEDRYLCILGPVFVLASVRALCARELPLTGIVLTAVLGALAIQHAGLYPNNDAYEYFIGTGAAFFKLVVLGKLRLALPFDDEMFALVLTALAAGAIALVVVHRERGLPRLLPAALLAALGLYCFVGAGYVMHKFTDEATRPTTTFSKLSFVDATLGTAPKQALLTEGNGDPFVQTEYFDAAYFNQSLGRGLMREGAQTVFTCCIPNDSEQDVVQIDPKSGALRLVQGKTFPPNVVQSAAWLAWSPAGPVIGHGVDPLILRHIAVPAHAAYEWLPGPALTADGWTVGTQTAQLRVYPGRDDGPTPCLTGSVSPAYRVAGGKTYAILHGPRGVVSVALTPPNAALFKVPTGTTTAVLSAYASVAGAVDGESGSRGLRLTNVELGPC